MNICQTDPKHAICSKILHNVMLSTPFLTNNCFSNFVVPKMYIMILLFCCYSIQHFIITNVDHSGQRTGVYR